MAYTSTRRSAKSSAKYVYCMGQTKGYVPLNTSRLMYRTRRRTARMARPANTRTDTQTGGRTHRSTDGYADGRTDTQKHGRRRTDADARTQTQAPDGARTLNIHACSAWVEKSSRRVLRLDERARTFEMYYSIAETFMQFVVSEPLPHSHSNQS